VSKEVRKRFASAGVGILILRKEKWLYGKTFVYSITYDEGFADLLENTVPIHDRFGFPGQLGLVAGQVGKPRSVPFSSWNGKQHMNVSQVQECLARGWGVSSHSMTHGAARSMYADPFTEVAGSRLLLEEVLEVPITSFIVPYDNENHPPVIDIARDNGYLSIFTLTDDVNNYGCDFYGLFRSPLIEEGFYPFYSHLDPYMRLHQARAAGGWVVDYTHLTNPQLVSPTKEISQTSLIRRFDKVLEVGGKDVWTANCDEVVDYMLLHMGTELLPCKEPGAWELRVNTSPRVTRRALTFSWEQVGHRATQVSTEPSRPVQIHENSQAALLFTIEIENGMRLCIG
jgi:peptidoglycan/xylan/chitin deacetylase (PgdA/CDA1 family)